MVTVTVAGESSVRRGKADDVLHPSWDQARAALNQTADRAEAPRDLVEEIAQLIEAGVEVSSLAALLERTGHDSS